MQPHPLKTFHILIFVVLSLTFQNAAMLNAYTYNTENKTDNKADYNTNQNTEYKTNYDSEYRNNDNTKYKTDYNSDYKTNYNSDYNTRYSTEADPQYETEQKARILTASDREPIGPAAFFDQMLRALTRKSDSQNNRIRELRASVPDILPDLYKVYLEL